MEPCGWCLLAGANEVFREQNECATDSHPHEYHPQAVTVTRTLAFKRFHVFGKGRTLLAVSPVDLVMSRPHPTHEFHL